MAKSSRPPAARDSVNLSVLREATGGDRDLMQELAQLYVNDSDLQLRALADAVENGEMDRIRRIGHAMYGSSVSIGANDAAQIFEDLTQCALREDVDGVRAAIERGTEEFERVKRCLADLR